MSSDLSGAVPTGAAAACDAIGARMLAGRLHEGGAGSTISKSSEAGRGSHDGAADHRNVLVCPVGLALALAVLRAGAADAGTDAALGIDSAPGTDAAPALVADGAPRVGVGTPDSTGPRAPGDSASPLPRDLVWSAVQRALRRFDVAGPEQLRSFNPDAIPETPLVHIANNILVVGEHVVRQDYLEAAKHWYDAEISRTPLAEAKTALDAWADLHTGGLIKQSAIVLRPDTVLVLQNALLFAARWERRFTKASTIEKQPFTRADGSTSRADLMTSTRPYTLVAGPGWRALRLPYNGGGATGGPTLAMDVILPNRVISPAGLPASTWGEATRLLTAAQAEDRAAGVRLRLPRLGLSSQPTDLTGVVESLGVRLGSQDHIGPNVSVSQVVQQVRLTVAEEGTVAAALTEITARSGALAGWEEDFVVDHPYVLRIVDQASGIALIEAAVLDPAAGSRPRCPVLVEGASRLRARLSRRRRGPSR